MNRRSTSALVIGPNLIFDINFGLGLLEGQIVVANFNVISGIPEPKCDQ